MLPQFFDRIDAFRRGFTNRAGLNVRSNDLKAISRSFLFGRFLMDLTKKPLAVFSLKMTTIVYVRALNVRAPIKGK
jgi:hypothetical protein